MIDNFGIIDLILFIAILLFSSAFHETAHAWVAYRCGDETAYRMGRISFNPLVHICPFNTIILPALLYFTVGFIFGGAKPVPIVPMNLRKPDRDLALSSAAGPISNMILAIFSVVILLVFKKIFGMFSLSTLSIDIRIIIVHILTNIILLNLILAFFNLIPIPPLDGSRILRYVIPVLRDLYDSMDTFGLIILIMLLNFFPELLGFILNLVKIVWKFIEHLYRIV